MRRAMAAGGWWALVLACAVTSTCVWSGGAWAGSGAEAKAAAREVGCTPSKSKTLRYAPGAEGETVYEITCSEDKKRFVVVRCRGRNCVVLRTPNKFSIH